jgi:hypothetical protein
MGRDETIIIRDSLADHPSYLAWRQINPASTPPESIEVLKPEKRKSAVYRMRDVGGAARSMIAKRTQKGDFEAEARIYAELFPRLSLPSLEVYAVIEEHDGYSWLFLEDAGEIWYSPAAIEHHAPAIDWLSQLHASASSLTSWLPDTGPAYFRSVLDAAREGMQASRTHPALSAPQVAVIDSVLACLDVVDRGWKPIAEVCTRMPRTVVHGDFVPKNVRVCSRDGRLQLLVFDWETAGIAPPAADLALLPGGEELLRKYFVVMRDIWPYLEWADLLQLRRVGRLFRLLHCVYWESRSFRHPWISRAMRHMDAYERLLNQLIQPDLPLYG